MELDALQTEINHLLRLYYNTINTLQQECMNEDIIEIKENLLIDIVKCKEKIDSLLNNELRIVESIPKFSILQEARNFVDDGQYLVDKITNLKS